MKADTDTASAGLGLSLRLALIYAILFTMAALALFFFAYYFVADALEERELEAVEERVREYRAWYLEGGLDALERRFAEQSRNTADDLLLRVMGPRGEVEYEFSGSGATRWTMVYATLPRGITLEAGRSSRQLERTLSDLRRHFTLTLIPTLLAGIALSTAVAFRGLQPIRKLIETVRDILATGDLDRRAPEARSGNELSELGALFNRLLDRNQGLVTTTRESLDAVAHDLRTPMTRLRNVAERALADGAGPEVQREGLETCLEESENALTLLRSLTEIAEAEAGALTLDRKPVAVAEIAGHVADLYEFVADERGIQIDTGSIPKGLTVEVDGARFQQILANLVDNAVKYSPDNTRVTLSAREDRSSGTVAISVADQGPGIPETDLPRIFDRLFRGDSSRSATPGLGLGLSLVRAIAQAHGGSVEVESTIGGGSTFTVKLPSP